MSRRSIVAIGLGAIALVAFGIVLLRYRASDPTPPEPVSLSPATVDANSGVVIGKTVRRGFEIFGLALRESEHTVYVQFYAPPGCSDALVIGDFWPTGVRPCQPEVPISGEVFGLASEPTGESIIAVQWELEKDCFDALERGDVWPSDAAVCADQLGEVAGAAPSEVGPPEPLCDQQSLPRPGPGEPSGRLPPPVPINDPREQDIWNRGCDIGADGLGRWTLLTATGGRLVTPAVPRSDRPVYGYLPDGRLVILGFHINIDPTDVSDLPSSVSLDITVDPPVLWEHLGGDDWASHPVGAVIPDVDRVRSDLNGDLRPPIEDIDTLINNYGGRYITDYQITIDSGRISIAGTNLSTITPQPFQWIEDEDGVLQPDGR